MSFLDLYQGDQDQAAKIQPNEGHDLPSGFSENFNAAWSDGQLFSQSIARGNARAGVLSDYIDEIRQKTGNDLSKEFMPDTAGGGATGVTDFDTANARVAKLKESYPDLDLNPMSEDEIDRRAVAKSQAAHRTYQNLEAGEKTAGGLFGSFLGSAGSAAADPINILALAVAPETGGASILSAALRWGALAGVSQAAIEAASDTFKEQVQPGYMDSGAPVKEIGGAFVGGAVLGGGFKALGNAWTRVKTGSWPTSVRDAGNVIESEANVASTNIFPGVEGEVNHRAALSDATDAILTGKPVDVSAHMTPQMQAHFDAYHGSPHDFGAFDSSKIDTGEGMQAYGHGLYFAENQKIAEGYAEELGKGTGSLYKVNINADRSRFLDHDKTMAEQSEHVRDVMRNFGIPEEINFPKLSNRIGEGATDEMKPLTGADAYRRLGVKVGPKEIDDTVGREAAASKALSEAGVPGIKYLSGQLDGGADGTHNFVVFDDKHVEITHKNGKPVNAEIRQGVIDRAAGLPPKEPELPLDAPAPEPVAPKERGPQPQLQTPDEMAKTLTAPDHQDAIRADIDRARAISDVQVPGIDENGNHTMVSVDAAMDEVDAYKKLADDIQVCANPTPEAEAA